MATLRSGAATDVGQVRHNNEDGFLVRETVFAVADGMGGHQGGEVASATALDTLAVSYVEHTAQGLAEAVEQANHAVHEKAAEDPELAGMGTTITVLAPIDDEEEEEGLLALANVGDSRAYLLRDGELTQVTEDHSLVAEMERDGRLSPEEAAIYPHRNVVTRALGIEPRVAVDTFTVIPYEGDRFLLCSDGLYDAVDDNGIAAVLRRLADPQECARELVRIANENGGRDNITVVVVDVVDDEGRAEAASASLAADPPTTVAPKVAVAPGMSAPTDTAAPSKADGKRGRRKTPRAEKPPQAERPRRFTWRVAVFLVVLLAIVAGGAIAVWLYARGTYFVAFADDQVAIFRGKPDGVLWIEPTLEETYEISRDDVPASRRGDLIDGQEAADLDEARRYVANLEDQIEELNRRATTTTTTTAPTTTSTAPPAGN